MKPIVFFLLLLLAGKNLSAQEIHYKKDKPVQLLYLEWVPLGDYSYWYVKKMAKEGFSKADAEAMMVRVKNKTGLPKAVESDFRNNTAVLSHYKLYEQYYMKRFGSYYTIFWAPYEENQHMPEELRPTDKGGFVILVNGRGISENGKDGTGSPLAAAGTPVSVATETVSADGKSGVTASGIQYSMGVDMSAFQKPFQGCMVYVNGSNGVVYVVPVDGNPVTSPGSIANAAFRFSVPGGSYTKYEWMGGVDARTILRQFKAKDMTVVQQRTYTLE